MIIECIDNEGFEDQLTVGMRYQAGRGENSFHITADDEQPRWYGESKFRIMVE